MYSIFAHPEHRPACICGTCTLENDASRSKFGVCEEARPQPGLVRVGAGSSMDDNPGPSEIATKGMSAVAVYDHFLRDDTCRAGCGGGLSRIPHSQNGALESASKPLGLPI